MPAHASHPRAAARDAVCDLLPSDTRSTKHVVSQHRAPTMRPPLRASRKSTRATQSQRRYTAKTRPCADAPATLDGSSASLRRPHRRHRSFTSTAEDSAATWKACQRRCALRSLLRRSRSSYRVPCIDACGVARPRASLLRNAVATATASPQTDPDASAQPIYFPRQDIVHDAACRPLIVTRCSLLARAVALRVEAALCCRQWG